MSPLLAPALRRHLADAAALAARVSLGVIFMAHGLQKVSAGVGETTAGFEAMGIPLPGVVAVFTMTTEVLGGLLLMLGAALPLTGICLAAVMAGAFLYAHADAGLFLADGGFEFVLALGAAALALGFNGGRWSVDELVGRRLRGDRPEPEREARPQPAS
ncbi:DoxX family protein [Allonocardiopsis opalescens]|uniref:Putative oxidoreductase n=1 Tax=Allonocardiopsis opalescens TaxID=1144618 RepID=A0A2T0PUZ1_9ACTN|nr:DoxX family protein [Allonocardiopsis opalescens]PRX92546.1 putative oxidoreductase [Allonocardiopsis opalescens]